MNEAKRDYYDVLGVERDAGEQEIKQAFRSLARTLHPDVSRAADAQEQFTEVARAYKVLSRPTARLLYDRFGYLGAGNGGFDPFQAGPVDSSPSPLLFDFAELRVDFVEAVRGGKRKVEVTTVGACAACGGTGASAGLAAEECRACDGEGRVRRSSDINGTRLLEIDTCSDCGGSGRVVIVPCARCLGSGRAKEKRKVKVEIPPGAEDGEMIRVEEGAKGRDGRARDLYLVLRVLPDRDSALVRYASAAALVLAVALFLVLLLVPDALNSPF